MEWYSPDSLQTTFLYTEGVKSLAIDDDAMRARYYFSRVLEIDSLHAPAHHQLADLLLPIDPYKALNHSEIAYAADSTNLDYASLYSYALYDCEEFSRAKVVCQRIINKDPYNPTAWRMMAALHVATDMPHLALNVLDSAEYKLGRQREIVEYKTALLVALKLYDRAIDETQKTIEENPREAQNYNVLGTIYNYAKRDSLAEQSYQKALEINPDHIETLFRLSDFYYTKGQDEKFLQVVRRIFINDKINLDDKIELFDSKIDNNNEFYRKNFFAINTLISTLHLKHPDHFFLTMRYAKHLLRAGEVEMALDKYKEVIRTEPYAPREAFDSVIDIEGYLGRRDSMMHYIDQTIERFYWDADLYFRKGFELLRGGDEKGAKKLFKWVAKEFEEGEIKSTAYAILGDQEANPNKAARHYKKALKLNPENATVLNNWAYQLCTHNGNLEQALEMSTKACEMEPTNATYLDTKAWILHLMGRTSEAKELMRQAISLDSSGDSTLLLHYGDILAAEGELFMAEIYYKRALEAGESAKVIEERIARLKK